MWKTIVGLILIGFGIHVIRGDEETPGSVGGGVIFILFGLGFVFFGYILPLLKQRKYQKDKEAAYNRWLQRNYSATMQEVDQMTGVQFEEFCAALLKKHGYGVKFTKATGDQGVDLVATKDGVKYAIQCKRYDSKLGNAPVQQVYAGAKIYDCSVPIVMTNSFFTPGAKRAASVTGVQLWDRNVIIDLHEASAKSDNMHK